MFCAKSIAAQTMFWLGQKRGHLCVKHTSPFSSMGKCVGETNFGGDEGIQASSDDETITTDFFLLGFELISHMLMSLTPLCANKLAS